MFPKESPYKLTGEASVPNVAKPPSPVYPIVRGDPAIFTNKFVLKISFLINEFPLSATKRVPIESTHTL